MNELFQWDESYSVGVAALDNEHKHLLALSNAILQASAQATQQDVVRNLLAELQSASAAHFAKEEDLMRKTGYPAYQDHHAKHERLDAEMSRFAHQHAVGHIETGKLAKALAGYRFTDAENEENKVQEQEIEDRYGAKLDRLLGSIRPNRVDEGTTR